MIVFDLKCGGGHVFEAWFGSTAAFDGQVAAGQVRCPICDDADIGKALMAPAIAAKGNRRPDVPAAAAIKRAMQQLATAQNKALENSRWVGAAFADQARAMHSGEREHAVIHGQTSIAEARALVDEGVPVAPLPFPVVPPDALN